MKYRLFLVTVGICTTVNFSVFANDAGINQPPPPNIYSYIAETPPKPNAFLEFIKHVYLSARGGASFMQVSSISAGPSTLTNRSANAASSSASDIVFNKGIAVGYQFPAIEDVLVIRTEVEYMNRDGFQYDANPPFTGSYTNSTLNSKIDDFTLMGNLIAGFKMHFGDQHFLAFAMGGAGMAQNTTKSNSFYYYTPNGSGLSSNLNCTEQSLAWDLGIGLEYEINSHLSTDLYYQYVNLGQVKWKMATNDSFNYATLSSNSFYTNTIMAALNVRL